eukprot:6468471-Amphidinium_carterae.1
MQERSSLLCSRQTRRARAASSLSRSSFANPVPASSSSSASMNGKPNVLALSSRNPRGLLQARKIGDVSPLRQQSCAEAETATFNSLWRTQAMRDTRGGVSAEHVEVPELQPLSLRHGPMTLVAPEGGCTGSSSMG